MATLSLLLLGIIVSVLYCSEAHTIIGFSSSFPHQDPPVHSPPDPTKQTALFWPSLPPRGRSDVPIRATVKDKPTVTNRVEQWQRRSYHTAQSTPSFISASFMHKLSSSPIVTQPTSSRARTDTANLAFHRDFAKVDATAKGLTLPLTTSSSPTLVESNGNKSITAWDPEEESVKDTKDDLPDLGSGSIPTLMLKDESPVRLPTVGEEMAQHQPSAQTAISELYDVKPSPENQTLKPHMFLLTTVNKMTTTPQAEVTVSTAVTQATPRTVLLIGEKSNI